MPAKPYSMPPVYLGQVVIWRHHRESPQPAPAIVTRVGDRAISVFVIPTESKVGIPKDGVRHEGDPELPVIQGDGGVWSYNAADRLDFPAAPTLEREKASK